MYEPPHDKANKMAFVTSEDSDQPGHLPSLIRVSLRTQWVANNPSFLHVDREDWSDRADARHSWIFAGRTCHFVSFVMCWLIYELYVSYNRAVDKQSIERNNFLISVQRKNVLRYLIRIRLVKIKGMSRLNIFFSTITYFLDDHFIEYQKTNVFIEKQEKYQIFGEKKQQQIIKSLDDSIAISLTIFLGGK